MQNQSVLEALCWCFNEFEARERTTDTDPVPLYTQARMNTKRDLAMRSRTNVQLPTFVCGVFRLS